MQLTILHARYNHKNQLFSSLFFTHEFYKGTIFIKKKLLKETHALFQSQWLLQKELLEEELKQVSKFLPNQLWSTLGQSLGYG